MLASETSPAEGVQQKRQDMPKLPREGSFLIDLTDKFGAGDALRLTEIEPAKIDKIRPFISNLQGPILPGL